MFIVSLFEFLLKIGFYLGFFLLLSLVMVYLMQNRMLYIPDAPSQAFRYPENNPKTYRNPGERNMLYDDVAVTTKDKLVLRGWFIKQKTPLSHETVIYFHENAGNIGNRLYAIETLYFELELNVLIVGYRGYGHSEGTPSEAGLAIDADAIFQFALNHKEINKQKLFVIGKSLGGAVAIQLAEKVQDAICGLILENTFTSISDIVDHIFPMLSYFKHIILRMHWASIERIPRVRIPMLFVVGGNDEIVPPPHAGRLFEAAIMAPLKQMHQVPTGMHNDTWVKGGKDYIYALKDFIDKANEHRQTHAPANNN